MRPTCRMNVLIECLLQKEQIVDFEKMMIEHLRVYRQYHNAFPTTIIYFRSCMPGTPNNEVRNAFPKTYLTSYLPRYVYWFYN